MSLCSEHTSAVGFTKKDIARWPPIRQRKVESKSIDTALIRFIKHGIVFSPGANSKGKRLYRIKHSDWAIAYIQGDKEKPWLPLTPTPEDTTFLEIDEHRDHFNIQLTQEWFKILKQVAVESNNQFTWGTKSGSIKISVNGKAYKGQVWVGPYWRTDAKKYFGEAFYEYLADQDRRGMRRGDFCLPVGMKGERITLGGRPTQWSASHYEAQLDVRAAKNDQNLRDGLNGLVNQADFNIKMLDKMDAFLEALEKQGETQTKIAETLNSLLDAINKKPIPEPEYIQEPQEKDDKYDHSYIS